MVIKTGRLVECFVILPSLHLNWVRTFKGTIYILKLGWLYWYIEVRTKPL